ncbi:MAG TPA: sulfotransferase domain-containing protein [Caulobacteraceae bacterium]|nr:sulfotransferase domain-containing protein [Caulobacteraceae bacterium]
MPEMLRAPTREYRTAVMDSRRWNAYAPRPDDIVIATYPKCGTTWTQRIVDLLVFQSTEPRTIMLTSRWLDATFFAPVEQDLEALESQTHRRFIKSHLPLDALPVFEGVKYIHVARDGRDACTSMHNHQLGFLPEMKQRIGAIAAEDPQLAGLPPPATPEDPREYFLQWIGLAEAYEGADYGVDLPFFEFEMTYWNERRRENLLLVHYNDLKADLPGEVRRIAEFLEIEVADDRLAELAAAARFETMKKQGHDLLPQLDHAFDRGHDRFLNKGTNGRWKDFLTADDLARYDALASRKLSGSAAAWITHGRLGAGDPASLPD